MTNKDNEKTSMRDDAHKTPEWRQKYSALDTDFNNLKGEFKKLSGSLSSSIASLKTEINTLEGKVKNINNTTTNTSSYDSRQLKKDIDGIRAGVIGLQGRCTTLEQRLTALEEAVPATGTISSIRSYIAVLRSDISTNSDAITQINNTLTRFEREIKAIKECVKTPTSRDKEDDIINLIHIALTIPILGMLFLASEKHIGCTIASFVLWGVAAIIITVYYKIYPHVSEMLDGRVGEIIDYSYMASPIFSLVAFILAIIAVAV